MSKTSKIYNNARIGTDFPIIGPDYPIESYYDEALDNLMALDICLDEFGKNRQIKEYKIKINILMEELAKMKEFVEDLGVTQRL
jgi:hypothetical protein